MGIFVRKIEKGKWLQNNIIEGEEVSADAITICSRTTINTLSTWFVQNEENIDDAILAIVSGHNHLDAIDIVCLDSVELKKKGLQLKQTTGHTTIDHFADTHFDIVDLSYTSLGTLADLIVSQFKLGRVKRYTKGKLKNLLNAAIDSGLLNQENLPDSISSKL